MLLINSKEESCTLSIPPYIRGIFIGGKKPKT